MEPRVAVLDRSQEKVLFNLVSQYLPGLVLDAGIEDIERTLSGHIEVVVTDLRIPDDEGLEFLHALRNAGGSRPVHVITLTGYVSRETTEKLAATIRKILSREHGPSRGVPMPESDPGKWNRPRLEEISEGMGISRATLARILGVSERNLSRWIKGEAKPGGKRDTTIQRLKYLFYLLQRAFDPPAIPSYLREPNPSLGGRTPLMALEAGDFDALEADLLQLIEGVYV
jgi:CheY-like chemotaxis protein/transcriptional regulator with XRE-family HTH domain